MKETTIIITTAITVQSEDNVDRDEIVCSVKTALRVDNSKLLDSLTLMEEEQTDDELVSEHSLNPIHPVSQEEFNKAFNKILEGSTQRYLNHLTDEVSTEKTTRIQVLNPEGEWLIDYDIDTKKPHFYYRYSRIYTILRIQFSLQDEEIQSLVKSLMWAQYKIKGVTPVAGDHFVTRL
jgi:hypothetical protein